MSDGAADKNQLLRLQGARLAAADGVQHGFYGRGGGVSAGEFASLNCSAFAGDSAAAVAVNRRRVAADLGARQLFTNRQMHGVRVRVVGGGDDADAEFAADGLVCAEPGVGIGVLAADCAPVLFADAAAGVIGAAHAGWKGALAGITDEVLTAMVALGARRQRVVCAVGPAIQRASYRVGGELAARYRAESPVACAACFRAEAGDGDGFYFDLPGYVRRRLSAAEVGAVDVLTEDTHADEARFFSYRRSCQLWLKEYGRQVAGIVLR